MRVRAAHGNSTRSFRRARWNLTRFFRRWIDHIANLSDLGGRKAADLRVLADDGLICGPINEKRLIVRNLAFEPLDIGAKLAQHTIRLLCRSAELFAFEGAHPWNIPFDDKLAQCHIFFSLIRTLTGKRLYPSLDHLSERGT